MTDLCIIHDYTSLSLPAERIRKGFSLIKADHESKIRGEIDIIYCSDYRIQKLNREYLERDRTTDVIAFPFHEDDLLGEIYVSLQRAKVQARRFRTTYDSEVTRLSIHGILHLLGYKDTAPSEKVSMRNAEDLYLDQI
ncbi:MAG: rRNA maturation RNase YbeY [Chitinivibrionales bacterium]